MHDPRERTARDERIIEAMLLVFQIDGWRRTTCWFNAYKNIALNHNLAINSSLQNYTFPRSVNRILENFGRSLDILNPNGRVQIFTDSCSVDYIGHEFYRSLS